jgi:hypothetical protein
MNAGRILATVALLVGATSVATAQTATQTVTFAVNAINRVSVSGPASLTVNTATAGSEPTDAVSSGITWAITTNQAAQKVTAELTAASGGNMPANVTLSANMAAPSIGTSDGAVSLSTTPVRLVNGITRVAQSGMALTLTLGATVAAGTVSSTTRDILYTVTTGP